MAQMPEAIILRKTEETKTGVTYCMADVKTNADRIRSMSDEELVVWFYSDDFPWCVYEEDVVPCTYEDIPVPQCERCLLAWLKEEADE